MKMKHAILLLLLVQIIFAQPSAFVIQNPKKAVIPFQLINNLIFIPVNVNGVDLTLLLDSGVSESILFSLDNKEINFNQVQKVKFSGLGKDTDVFGLKSINNRFSIGKDYTDAAHTLYLILNEEFNFSSHIGIPVNGIIGYDFFKDYPVKIDFISKKITIYKDRNYFERKNKRFQSLDLTVEENKPYLYVDVKMKDVSTPSKLLLDLGNSDAVWLFPKLIKDFVYNRPNIEDYLGRGFNGDIYGKRSRIKEISLAGFSFEKPHAAMPDEYSIQHLRLVKNRKGSLGNEILRRFTVILDYPENKIYLKKNANFYQPFLFNMSGLEIKNDGMQWDKDLVRVETKPEVQNGGTEVYTAQNKFQYKFSLKPIYAIAGVREDSPAYEAGVKKNDVILKINNKKASDFTLEQILDLLKSGEDHKITMQIQRNLSILTFTFLLKDPIPYQEN